MLAMEEKKPKPRDGKQIVIRKHQRAAFEELIGQLGKNATDYVNELVEQKLIEYGMVGREGGEEVPKLFPVFLPIRFGESIDMIVDLLKYQDRSEYVRAQIRRDLQECHVFPEVKEDWKEKTMAIKKGIV
jgi:hypothetical protein